MNTSEIQARLDRLVTAMLAKGLREPRASARMVSDEQPSSGIEWKDASKTYGTAYEYPRGDTIAEAIEKAEAFIAAMPSPDVRRMTEFTEALASVIELGRANGIDVQFVNPLTEAMKRLSENALTHRQAAE